MKKNLKNTFCLIKQPNIYHRRKISRLHENEIKIKLVWVVKLPEIKIYLRHALTRQVVLKVLKMTTIFCLVYYKAVAALSDILGVAHIYIVNNKW